MPVTVFVWLKSETGHASLKINGHPELDQKDKRSTYVSFYPAGRQDEVTKKGALFGMKSQSSTMLADTNKFKNMPDYTSPPINGLDEEAMIKRWADLHKVQYGLLTHSCATMVFDLLRVGVASRDFGFAAKAILTLSQHQPVYPRDCMLLADILARTAPK